MNRYDEFEHKRHQRYERSARGGDYDVGYSNYASGGYDFPSTGSTDGLTASDSAVTKPVRSSSTNQAVADYSSEDRPRRLRTRRTNNLKSLYPSVRNLPDIPRAAIVFAKVGRQMTTTTTTNTSLSYDATTPEATTASSRSAHAAEPSPPSTSRSPPQSNRDHREASQNPVEEEEDDKDNYDRPLVEVSPGHWVELRGSEETWNALQRDFHREVGCFCCEITMHVIADAAMVLCPECRMISPIDDVTGMGLGLGVKVIKEEAEYMSAAGYYQSDMNAAASTAAASVAAKKKDGDWKEETDSGHSIQRKREPTTNLGARSSTASRERSASPARTLRRYR